MTCFELASFDRIMTAYLGLHLNRVSKVSSEVENDGRLRFFFSPDAVGSLEVGGHAQILMFCSIGSGLP